MTTTILILQIILLLVAAACLYLSYDAFMCEEHNKAAKARWLNKTSQERSADAAIGHYGPSFRRSLAMRLIWWLAGRYYVLAGHALNAYDYIIDSINLHQSGYRCRTWFLSGEKCWIKYGDPEPGSDYITWDTFDSRVQALDHMRDAIAEQATREAIAARGTNFSGKSRNVPCPCGSGKKFKSCCMTPNYPYGE